MIFSFIEQFFCDIFFITNIVFMDSKILFVCVLFSVFQLYTWGQTSEVSSKLNYLMIIKERDKKQVVADAESYLIEKPETITSYIAKRSSGGKHDFFSEGDYWWPDSANPQGPYVRRDGLTNPENFVEHRQALIRFSIQTAALTAAYKITGNTKYARKAVQHLTAWFVDTATMMNPNLLYAQAIKGRFTGRGIGIIDAIHLVEVAKSVMILERNNCLKGDKLFKIKKWFGFYLDWVTTHPYGKDEMEQKNNHGTCWVMQTAMFARLTGDAEKIEFCKKRFKEILLPGQMASNGSFPLELERTKPYNYSLFNLDAMSAICMILSDEKESLWEFTLPDGRNMKRGIDFMYPYIKDKTKWPYPKDVMFFEYYPVRQISLIFGAAAYNDKNYLQLWKTLEAKPTNEEVIRNFPIRQPVLWF